MNIWVIGREYPESYNNMAGSFELKQAQMLASEHTVFYPCVDLHSIRRWRKWGIVRTEQKGVNVYRANLPVGWAPGKSYVWMRNGSFHHLLDRIEKEHGLPDVIHVHYPALLFALYDLEVPLSHYRARGIKIVCTEHWSRVQTKEIDERFRKGLCWFAENADAFLCVGKALRESIRSLTGTEREIEVIPNVVDRVFFETHGRASKGNVFRFIAVGRLVPGKQFDKLIEAFGASFKDEPGVRLTIVGGGEMRETLAAMIDSLGMRDRIELTGTKSREEVAQLIADSDVLVCPSRLETFGVPAAEAMACGKPFIGTEALSFTDQIPAGCGILVDSQSQDELVRALRDSYENMEQFDSRAAIRAAKELFSEEAVRDRLNTVYLGR